MHNDEKTLLEGCIQKDKKAWDSFVDRYSRLVSHAIVRTLEQYGRNPDANLVEDLFQSFFLLLIQDNQKKLRQFRGDSSLSTWLHIIAVRMTIDFLRKKSNRPSQLNDSFKDTPSVDRRSASWPHPREAIIESEEKHLLEQAKMNLNPRERLFFNLYYRLELSYPEIASILNTTQNNLYVLNNRIKEKMKRIAANLM